MLDIIGEERAGVTEPDKMANSSVEDRLSNTTLADLREILYGTSTDDKLAAGLRLLQFEAKSGDVDYDYFLAHIASDEAANKLWEKLLKLVEAIKPAYERMKKVNAPLIVLNEVPEFPTYEAALKSMLNQLTIDQLKYILAEGRSPFGFQVKLVAPSNRVDLLRALIDGHPKTMNTPQQEQQELYIWDRAARHLADNNDESSGLEWRWSLYQDAQVIDEVEAWDDVNLVLEERVKAFKAQLPEGMTGTDRFTWSASMANGLAAGKPMDIRFEGNATDTQSYEKWHFTILDEEGELTESGIRYLVGGIFLPRDRRACLSGFCACGRGGVARLRAAVDGYIGS